MCKSCDEDELDQDEGKSSHHTDIMPSWEKRRTQSIKLWFISGKWDAGRQTEQAVNHRLPLISDLYLHQAYCSHTMWYYTCDLLSNNAKQAARLEGVLFWSRQLLPSSSILVEVHQHHHHHRRFSMQGGAKREDAQVRHFTFLCRLHVKRQNAQLDQKYQQICLFVWSFLWGQNEHWWTLHSFIP